MLLLDAYRINLLPVQEAVLWSKLPSFVQTVFRFIFIAFCA